MPGELVTAIVAGVFMVVGSLVTLAVTADQRKSETAENDATAAARITEAWQGLVEPLEKRIDALERENAHLTAAVSVLTSENVTKDRRIMELEAEVAALQKELAKFKEGRGK